MPNWACNHIVASGDEKDLRALAETLNTMPNLENGFGRYWMGNLAAALMGVTRDDLLNHSAIHLRAHWIRISMHRLACAVLRWMRRRSLQ